MTYAPATLTALARYWISQGGVNLGVVGDPAHAAKGVSYHLGADELTATAYSRTTRRDKAGLTNAASAIDLGRLDGSLGKLRSFSSWLVNQGRMNKPGTSDIREIIYSPDGKRVLRWDRERGYTSLPRPGEADLSHLTHTHVSYYRDSQNRDKTQAFRPFFTPPPVVRYRIQIATGTTSIRVYALGTTGVPRCIAGPPYGTDVPWGGSASSAACLAEVLRKTCDGKSGATTAYVPTGPLKGHVRVGAVHGVTVEKVGG